MSANVAASDGVAIARFTGDPLVTIEDLAAARVVLEEAFESFSDIVWDTVIDQIRRDGWTGAELRDTVTHLLRTKRWVYPGDTRPRLTVADLLTPHTPRLYDQRWYYALTPHERRDVEIYEVKGKIWYAPAGTNAPLPRWNGAETLRRVADTSRALPEGDGERERVAEAAREALARMRRLAESDERISLLEEQNRRLQEAIRLRDEEFERLRDVATIQELNAVLTTENQRLGEQLAALFSEREEMVALLRWHGDRGEWVIRWESLLERLMRDSVDGAGPPGESPDVPPNRTTSQQGVPYTTIGHAISRFVADLGRSDR